MRAEGMVGDRRKSRKSRDGRVRSGGGGGVELTVIEGFRKLIASTDGCTWRRRRRWRKTLIWDPGRRWPFDPAEGAAGYGRPRLKNRTVRTATLRARPDDGTDLITVDRTCRLITEDLINLILYANVCVDRTFPCFDTLEPVENTSYRLRLHAVVDAWARRWVGHPSTSQWTVAEFTVAFVKCLGCNENNTIACTPYVYTVCYTVIYNTQAMYIMKIMQS